jgi:hypothetical protein
MSYAAALVEAAGAELLPDPALPTVTRRAKLVSPARNSRIILPGPLTAPKRTHSMAWIKGCF